MATAADDIADGVMAHYGVKGMRWGVRKDGPRGAIRRGATKANVALDAGQKVIEEGEKKLIFLPESKRVKAAGATQARVLVSAAEINQSPKFKGKDLKGNTRLKNEYFKKVEEEAKEIYKEELDIARVQAFGDLLGVDTSSTTNMMRFTMSSDRIKHEAEQEVLLELHFVLDDLGHIQDITVPEKFLQHDADVVANGVLEHFGVKGMKWGFRKNADGKVEKTGRTAAPKSADAQRADEIRKKKVSEMSNEELQALNTRLSLEQNYASLAFKQDTKEIRAGQEIIKTLMGTAKMAGDVSGLISGATTSPSAVIIKSLIKSGR